MAVRSLQRSHLVSTVQIDRGAVLCPYIQVLIAIPWSPHKRATATIAAAPPRHIPISLAQDLQSLIRGERVWWPGRQECLWPAGKAAWAALTVSLLGNISALGTAGGKGVIKPGEVFRSKSRFTPAPRRVSASQKFATVLSSASHFVPLPRELCDLPEPTLKSLVDLGWLVIILGLGQKPHHPSWVAGLFQDEFKLRDAVKEALTFRPLLLVFQNVHLFLLLFFPLVLMCIVIAPQTECSMGISLSLDTS